jgi:hypothetical protein
VPAEEKVQEAEAIPFSPLNFMELFLYVYRPGVAGRYAGVRLLARHVCAHIYALYHFKKKIKKIYGK